MKLESASQVAKGEHQIGVIENMPVSPGPREQLLTRSSQPRDSYENIEMDDLEETMATVAHLLEQLHAKISSQNEKELITSRLLSIARDRKEVRALIGSHAQAMPLFISILRNGTCVAKVNVASTLSVLCKDDDLRLKVLLGGCVPSLLSLLKSDSTQARKAAAEAIYEVSSGGLSDDHVGMKIFVTEGVVPTLWEQLNPRNKQDRVVEGFVTGALRNLCGDKDGYWRATLEAGGVDIIVELLSSDSIATQSNAASLLARLILAFSDSISKVIASGAVRGLLRLVSQKNDMSVRASAADALEALSSTSTDAKKAVVEADGLSVLIGAIVAPSKECMQGEGGQDLQKHALKALANICNGMSSLILYLGKLPQSPRLATPVGDVIGALAYSLMVYERVPSDDEEPVDAKQIEEILVSQLKPRDNELIQERVLEAMASLYGNSYLSVCLSHAEAKKVLIGLTTMSPADVQEYLILSLISLCCDGFSIWEAIGKREGIQLLISLLGLSTEQHQEYAVGLLAILTEQIDDSKWAITAAGGIPPLVQLLETGSHKAREDAAHVLRNLCSHSEDIRACVESAGAIPAFLWLLKCGGSKGQEGSAKALTKLIRNADSATINQLLALLLEDSPSSKAQTIRVLGHVLTLALHGDLVHKGAAACKGLKSLVQLLNSSDTETQECAAAVLADIFSTRQDICNSFATDEVVLPCMKLLTSNVQGIATHSARALGALSRPMKTKSGKKMSYIADGDVKPLIMLAKATSIDATETAVAALANLLSDFQIAAEALAEEIVPALIRVLGDGSSDGKKNAAHALHQILRHFPVGDVFKGSGQCQFAVLSVMDSLSVMDRTDALEALEVLAMLAKTKQNVNFSCFPWSSLAEVPSTLEPLVRCVAEGPQLLQDKAIEILCRLCRDQPVLLGDLLASKSGAISGLSKRIVESTSLEVRVGSAALLICAVKECKFQSMDALDGSGSLEPLIYALVDMMKRSCSSSSLEIEVRSKIFVEKNAYQEADEFDVPDPATAISVTTALWLLSLISSFHGKNRITVVEAGALEVLSDKLASHTSNPQAELEDTEGIWISALLLAILFHDENAVSSPTTMRIIPLLALLLKSEQLTDRYFAAQAMTALVCTGTKGMNLAIANSGAVSGLMTLIGCVESDMPNLVALCEEFSLFKSPDQVILDHLFEIEDVRLGSTARKAIPLLVDLLKPMPDRPGAPLIAVRLLTRIADDSDTNKLMMAEAGALEVLTKYLSLGPQDSTEAAITELLRILYSNPELIRHEASVSSLNQLIAVLRFGSKKARLSAAGALDELFDAKEIIDSELSKQAVRPLVDMLESTSEAEQSVALTSLIKLTYHDSYKATMIADMEQNPLSSLLKILSLSPSLDLKTKSAELCFILFSNSEPRATEFTIKFVEPLLLLIQSDIDTAVESGVCALETLLNDGRLAESLAFENVIDLLVSLVSGSNKRLIEASIGALIKVGQNRTLCKLHMFKAEILENCLELLPTSSGTLCSSIAEVFRILTNIGAISESSAAAEIVNPLFGVLFRSDITLSGQHSALQALVNVLEKPQSLVTLELSPSQIIEPLIPFLLSSSQAVQQLSTELLSRLLELEHFKLDITTKNAVLPLVQLAGIGILKLQETAIKALENISLSWPTAVVDAGGIMQLSKVIIQNDPQPSPELWESATLVLSNILCLNVEYYDDVAIIVLVKMLRSARETTVTVALKALIVLESIDPLNAEEMALAGAIDALLTVLILHRCEEPSGRLLESLFNNKRVREMKVSKYAIKPLAQYLSDPQTRSDSGRLFAALALGDLSQHEGLARASDSVLACTALIRLLEEQPTEEMKMVAICALQNFVMRSRTNKRAIAEVGGILVIQELLLSPNREVAGQAASLVKYLFSNHTLQEYVSNELIRSLTAALEKELWSSGTINEEALKAINVIFTNFPKLHISEAATLCIPQLVVALKSGGEAAQDSALDTLTLLKQSWSTMPIDISKSQAMIASEAIPILQGLVKTCPPSFHERADSLLHCLPGCLTVTILRGNNLRHVMGGTNAFCKLSIGNGPPQQTKVVSNSTSPEWEEGFTWTFDVPPKGQKLHILCKSKSTFGKSNLGTVTIQIDKVVSEGQYSGLFSLSHDRNKDSSRTLEIVITWSNGLSLESD